LDVLKATTNAAKSLLRSMWSHFPVALLPSENVTVTGLPTVAQ
jgi:hypothetical protein